VVQPITKITITTNDLVSIPAAAKELGVDFSTIYRWIRSGEVAAFWIGKQRYLTTATLELLKEQSPCRSGGRIAHDARHSGSRARQRSNEEET